MEIKNRNHQRGKISVWPHIFLKHCRNSWVHEKVVTYTFFPKWSLSLKKNSPQIYKDFPLKKKILEYAHHLVEKWSHIRNSRMESSGYIKAWRSSLPVWPIHALSGRSYSLGPGCGPVFSCSLFLFLLFSQEDEIFLLAIFISRGPDPL